jgi:hypothetical protein
VRVNTEIPFGEETGREVRVSIVAGKWGNAHGAKGHRKEKT